MRYLISDGPLLTIIISFLVLFAALTFCPPNILQKSVKRDTPKTTIFNASITLLQSQAESINGNLKRGFMVV